jgi:hypothetical protein
VREVAPKILEDMAQILAPPDEIPVSKGVRDRVAFLLSGLTQGETQSFSLAEDIIELGSTALSAVLENAYKVRPNTKEFEWVAEAVVALARLDRSLALRCIEAYGTSSDYGARELCRRICEAHELFPETLLQSIVDDDGVYVSRERVQLADMCIRISDRPDSVLTLCQYMSRELILNPDRYFDLRNRIACRMGELNFPETAKSLVDDARIHVWEDLLEFRALAGSGRTEQATSILQLYGDAFGSLGDSALQLFKAGKVPTYCDRQELPIFRTFLRKLASAHPPSKTWVRQEMQRRPTRDLQFVWDRLSQDSDGADAATADPPEVLLRRYLATGGRAEQNDLRFLDRGRRSALFRLLDAELRDNPASAPAIMSLLERFQGAARREVTGLACCHWDLLAGVDYAAIVKVVCTYHIPDVRNCDEAITRLERDLEVPRRKDVAREGLDKLLQMRSH